MGGTTDFFVKNTSRLKLRWYRKDEKYRKGTIADGLTPFGNCPPLRYWESPLYPISFFLNAFGI